ncbi:MAG: hypothetical protein ACREIA_06175 [Opitutaceae bacterium]
MKITDVEAFVLESPFENRPPAGSEEVHGVKHCLLLKVSTDEGLVGWSDVETAPHVAAVHQILAEQSGGAIAGAPHLDDTGFPLGRLASRRKRAFPIHLDEPHELPGHSEQTLPRDTDRSTITRRCSACSLGQTAIIEAESCKDHREPISTELSNANILPLTLQKSGAWNRPVERTPDFDP